MLRTKTLVLSQEEKITKNKDLNIEAKYSFETLSNRMRVPNWFNPNAYIKNNLTCINPTQDRYDYIHYPTNGSTRFIITAKIIPDVEPVLELTAQASFEPPAAIKNLENISTFLPPYQDQLSLSIDPEQDYHSSIQTIQYYHADLTKSANNNASHHVHTVSGHTKAHASAGIPHTAETSGIGVSYHTGHEKEIHEVSDFKTITKADKHKITAIAIQDVCYSQAGKPYHYNIKNPGSSMSYLGLPYKSFGQPSSLAQGGLTLSLLSRYVLKNTNCDINFIFTLEQQLRGAASILDLWHDTYWLKDGIEHYYCPSVKIRGTKVSISKYSFFGHGRHQPIKSNTYSSDYKPKFS